MCDPGETDTCPGDCDDGDHGDAQGCCESADDACHWSGDGVCQSGCAWGHDPDCDPQPPTTDDECCADANDSCGWRNNGVCDSGCAFVDPDCHIDCQPGPFASRFICKSHDNADSLLLRDERRLDVSPAGGQ
jgi:hypothetical protein